MTIFSCEKEWAAMLTCIYDAWASKIGHKNIRLVFEPIAQQNLFDTYIHVEADPKKAESVMDAVVQRISRDFYDAIAFCSASYEEDVMDVIYRMLLLGFKFGPSVRDMRQYREVCRFEELSRKVRNESHHFREFIRFHEIRPDVYVAHIEPKSRIVGSLGAPFQDRMPSLDFMIVDDVHREAVIHEKNKPFYMRILTEEELARLLETEEMNDEYTDLWKVFFETIAIKERTNPTCQNNLFPIWKRKHAVEFL